MHSNEVVGGFAEAMDRAARVPELEARLARLERTVVKQAATSSTEAVPDRMLNVKQVARRVGLSRPSVYRLVAEGRFPRQVKVGSAAARWSEAEVERWIESRQADR